MRTLEHTVRNLIILALTGLVAVTAQATSGTKTDTTTMNDAADWSAGALGTGDTGTFDNTITAGNAANLTLGADLSISALVFGTMNGPVTIGADNTLTLNADGATGLDLSAASHDVTINSAIAVDPGGASPSTHVQYWNVDSGRTLTIGGGITIDGWAYLTKTGAGDLVVDGNIAKNGVARLVSNDGTFTVNGNINASGNSIELRGTASGTVTGSIGDQDSIKKYDTGTWTLTGDNSAHWHQVRIYDGVLNVQNATALGRGDNTVIVYDDGAPSAALEVQGGISFTGAGTLTLNGTGISSGGVLRNISGENSLARPITLGSATRINSDAGTLMIDVASGNAIAGAFNLTIGGDGHVVIADPIATSTGQLTKDGNGMLTLTGANTFTGSTAVDGGTLLVNSPGSLASGSAVTVATGTTLGGNGTVSGAVSVSARGVLMPGSAAETIGTLTLGSTLSLSGGTNVFDVTSDDTAGTTYDQIAVAGTLTMSGDNVIELNAPAPSYSIANGTYTLMSFAASTESTFKFSNGTTEMTVGGATLTLVNGTTSLQLTVSGGPAYLSSLTWDGSVNTTWDTSTENWLRGGSASVFVEGDSVAFDDTATGYTVTGSGAPSSVTFNNTTAYTVSAVIGGTGTTILKSNTGTVTLSGNNTYTGGVTINGGVLQLGNAGALNSTTPNTVTFGAGVASGTKLQLNGNNVTVASLNSDATPGSPVVESGSGTAGTDTLTVNNSVENTFAGVLQNGSTRALALAKSGAGTLTLSGANTYGGITTVNAGTLKAANQQAMGNNANVYMGTNTVLELLSDTSATFGGSGGAYTINGLLPQNASGVFTVRVDRVSSGSDEVISIGTLKYNDYFSHYEWAIEGANGYSLAVGSVVVGLNNRVTKLSPNSANLTVGTIYSGADNQANPPLHLAGTGVGVVTGVIGDGGANSHLSVTKSDSSTWTLQGDNTYTGPTAVNGGTLFVNGTHSGSGAWTVASAATLGGNGTVNGAVSVSASGVLIPGSAADTIGKLTLGSTLALNGGTTVFDLTSAGTAGTTYDQIAVSGALTMSGSNVIEPNPISGSIANGTYTLMTFAASTESTFKFSNESTIMSMGSATLTLVNGTTSLQLTVSGGPAIPYSLTWKGSVNTTWDTSTENWLRDGSPDTFVAGDGVLFDDTATAFTVTGSGAPSSVAFDNESEYTVSAVISGTDTPVFKGGTGEVTLSGANTYSGGATVNAGTLTVGNTTALGSGGATVNADGNLNIGSYNVANAITLNGGTLNLGVLSGKTYGSTITLDADSTISAYSYYQTLSGQITGTGGLTITGSSTPGVTLSNTANDFQGNLTVASGAFLQLSDSEVMPDTATVTNNGTLKLNGGDETIAGLSGSGALYTDTGSSAATVSIGYGDVDSSTSGTIGNSGDRAAVSVTKIGSGTLTLSGASKYSGATTVATGTLKAGVASVIGTSGAFGNYSAVTMANTAGAILDLNDYATEIGSLTGGGSSGGNVTLGSATLTVGGANTSPAAYAGEISGTGGLTMKGSGTLTLSGANTYSGETRVNQGTIEYTGSGSSSGNGSLLITSAVSGQPSVFTLNTAGEVEFSGVTFALGHTGPEGMNVNAGTLTVGSGGITPNGNHGGGGYYLNFNGGTLKSSAAFGIASSYAIPIKLNTGTSVLDTTGGNITVGSGSPFLIGTGAGSLTVQGGNTLTLPAGNTYSGNTLVTGNATLKLGASTLPGLVTVDSGSTFDLNNASSSIAGLAGAGTVVNSSSSASRTLTITGDGGNDFSGSINPESGDQANTALTIDLNSGVQTLSGASAYSGATSIEAGTLRVTNQQGMGNNQTVYMRDSVLQLLSDSSVTFGPNAGASGYRLYGKAEIEGNSTIYLDRLSAGNENKVITLDGIDYYDVRSYTWNITGDNGYSLAVDSVRVPAARTTTLNPTTANVTLGAVSGMAAPGSSANSSLKLDGTSTGNSVTGVISDGPNGRALDVTKSNDSTWTLNGDSTYTGPTAVNGGTLFVNGTHTGGGTYTVASTATLAGEGTINAAITLSSGGILAPGDADGYGVLTVGGAANLSSGTFVVKIGDGATEYSQLKADGVTVTLGGTLTIDDSACSVGAEREITILDVTTAEGSRSGVFSNYADGDSYRSAVGRWTVHYDAPNGNVRLAYRPCSTIFKFR